MKGKRLNCNSESLDEVTESTEKMYRMDAKGKFEIVLDIVKVNTSVDIEESL